MTLPFSTISTRQKVAKTVTSDSFPGIKMKNLLREIKYPNMSKIVVGRISRDY